MATTQNLLVPINVQALCIGSNETLLNQFVQTDTRFADLPYYSPKKGYQLFRGGKKSNISENFLTQPFVSATSQKAGIHLHWTLPDALNQSTGADNDLAGFPVVPNRWLVTRIQNPTSKNPTYQSWIVESDYLHPNEGPIYPS